MLSSRARPCSRLASKHFKAYHANGLAGKYARLQHVSVQVDLDFSEPRSVFRHRWIQEEGFWHFSLYGKKCKQPPQILLGFRKRHRTATSHHCWKHHPFSSSAASSVVFGGGHRLPMHKLPSELSNDTLGRSTSSPRRAAARMWYGRISGASHWNVSNSFTHAYYSTYCRWHMPLVLSW